MGNINKREDIVQNPDYLRKDLTQTDQTRIYRMKLAADMVQDYHVMMSEDHRSLEMHDHEARVNSLLESVTLVLEYSESQEGRARFFVANVFESIFQMLKNDGIEHTSWLNPQVISALYKREELVMEFMEETAVEIGYACGNFVAENNPSVQALAALEQARAGDTVGADFEYLNMLEPDTLFEAMAGELANDGFRNVADSDVDTKARAFVLVLQDFQNEFDIDQILDADLG